MTSYEQALPSTDKTKVNEQTKTTTTTKQFFQFPEMITPLLMFSFKSRQTIHYIYINYKHNELG